MYSNCSDKEFSKDRLSHLAFGRVSTKDLFVLLLMLVSKVPLSINSISICFCQAKVNKVDGIVK